MRIKMTKGDKEERFFRLHKHVLHTMEIEDGYLILRGIDCSATYRLEKKYPPIKSKFNYEFVRRLIENAD